jgi:LysR family nitrogen assimilation transcriptional regulator
MTPDLKQLRTFVAVAEAGSLGAAAATLRIAQSALSRHVQALEHACRSPLFQRTARGVVLTEAGRLLLPRARLLLSGLEAAMAEVSELNREPSGRVRIAAPASLAEILYPPLAARVLAQLPRVRLELTEELSGRALDGLRDGLLDLAIITVPQEDDPRLALEPLFRERMTLIGQPGDALLGPGARIPLARLPGLPLILPAGAGWLGMVRRRLGRGAALEARVQVESSAPMKAMVRAGLGYAILPFSAVQAEIAAGSLAGARIEGFEVPRVLALPQARPVGRAAAAVAQAIRAEAAAMLAAGTLGWLPVGRMGGPGPVARGRSPAA